MPISSARCIFRGLIVPIAAVMVAFVDFLISFAILVALMIWYQFMPGWQILLLPVFAGIAFMASLGIGVWITALNVKYRDFRYVIPFIVQLGLYVSPVGFSSSIIPDQWRLAYSLNPMVGVIDGFRWCLLGGESQLYLPGFVAQPWRRRLFPVAWHPPVQEDGKELCRSDLIDASVQPMSDIVIAVENLSKSYLVGHQSAAARTVHRAARRHRPRGAQFCAQGGRFRSRPADRAGR